MENSPELDGKYLGTISKDFVVVSETLREAAYQVRKRGFSDFPIFPISRTELPIGQLLIGKRELAINWNYNITYLDEFIQRKLIDEDKVEAFKESYRNPDEFCCLFVVDGAMTGFIFIPYPEDGGDAPLI